MNENYKPVKSENNDETPVRQPLFRRYQIQIKAGLNAGAIPLGRYPFE
jgi:hypothetical protein